MKKERVILLVLAAVNFTHILDFMILIPLNPFLTDAMELNPAKFGLLVSSYSIAGGVVGFLGSFVVERFERKHVLLFVYTGFIVGTTFCALSDSYETFLIARVLTGVFAGVLGALVLSIAADVFPYERRAEAVAYITLGFTVSSIVGVPFGLFLAERFSWNSPFWFVVAIAIVLWFMVVLFIPKSNNVGSTGPPKFSLNMHLGKPQIWALIFFLVMVFSHFIVIPAFSDYMHENVGFAKTEIKYLYFAGGIATIFSQPIIGKMADKYGKKVLYVILSCIAFVPVWLLTNLESQNYVFAIFVVVIFFAFAGGRLTPGSTLVISSADPKHRASFMSVRSSVQYLAMGSAAFVGGLILEKQQDGTYLHYDTLGYVSIGLTFLAMILVKPVKPQG